MQHKVLLLGAGRVAEPLVDYLTRDGNVGITIVSAISEEVCRLSAKYQHCTPIVLDVVKSCDQLEKIIDEHHLIISMLPCIFHANIAKLCISHKKNMLTASYVSPEMKKMEQSAIDAGITIFQEIGLDPGIDHLLAMNCFDQVKEDGGKIVSFKSFCGGLPAPEDADNPLHYKFSWSPKGALMVLMNGATYLEDDKVIEIAAGSLLDNAQEFQLFPGFNLECYPNRDSTIYKEKYGLDDDVKTILRGTIRYQGFSKVCQGLVKLGFLDLKERPGFKEGTVTNWCSLINNLLGTSELNGDDLRAAVYEKIEQNDAALKGIQELGLLSCDVEVTTKSTPLDTLSEYLSEKLTYGPGERDLVLLNLQFDIEWPAGKKETRDINLISYGDPNGYSAMAKCVGIPAAIAAKMMLDGEVSSKGNVVPLTKNLYEPLLKRISNEGIKWTTTSVYT